MSYVIAEPCVGVCEAACVEVCPTEAIWGERKARVAGLQLYIDPEECICCGACAPVCPVEAIFDEDDLPAKWAGYREINARASRERHS